MGRRKAKIDWDKVDRMLMAGCDGMEISSFLGMHYNTFYNRVKSDKKCDFSEYSQAKRSAGDSLLKMKQMDVAMTGDKSMLIWLGKQRLGQSDKKESINTVKTDSRTNQELLLELSKLEGLANGKEYDITKDEDITGASQEKG